MAFIARLNFSGQKYRSTHTTYFGNQVISEQATPHRFGQNIALVYKSNQLKIPATIRMLAVM
ncbi:hypothetical protein ACJVDH_13065 [Pedobacter sp. AW1-32]|uniref:hypothetical protein n=1 Tax=Pedobacter sp. AW1-32 TaxID=3383026 RepID=UPI003FF08D87